MNVHRFRPTLAHLARGLETNSSSDPRSRMVFNMAGVVNSSVFNVVEQIYLEARVLVFHGRDFERYWLFRCVEIFI